MSVIPARIFTLTLLEIKAFTKCINVYFADNQHFAFRHILSYFSYNLQQAVSKIKIEMKTLIIYLFLSYLLIGCGAERSPSKESSNDTLLFHWKIAPPQKDKLDTLLLSEIADSIQYTQLKTSSPITFFINCEADNFIPILSNSIQLYNSNGEFRCNIGSVGRGHGEYIRLKWTVSEKNNDVYI